MRVIVEGVESSATRNNDHEFAAGRIKAGLIGKLEILLSAGVTKKRVHTRLIKLRTPFKNNGLHPYSKAI